MKVISMTDFVLEQTELFYEVNKKELANRIVNYAQFLKQPLALDMFIGDKAWFEGFYLDDDFIWFEHLFIYELDKLRFYCIEDMLSNTYLEDQYINLTQHAIKHLGL